MTQAALHAPPPRGAFEALLSDFTALLGLPPSRGAAPEPTAAEPLEQAAQRLANAGHPARVVRVTMRQLDELSLPTLVELQSRKAAILLGVSRGAVRLVIDGEATTIARSDAAQHLTGEALDVSGTLPATGAFLVRLWRALGEERRHAGKLALLSLSVFGLALAPPLLTRWALDRAVVGEDASLLSLVAAALTAAKLHQAWLGLLRERARIALEGSLEARVQRGVFAHLVQLPFSIALRQPMGSLLESLSSGVNVARALLGSNMLLALDAVLSVVYLASLLALLPSVGVVCAFTSLLTFALVLVLGRRMARLKREHLASGAAQQSGLHTLLAGAPTWKALAAEVEVSVRWLSDFIAELGVALRQERTELWLGVWMDAVHKATRILVLIHGARLVIEGELTLGSMLAFAAFTDGFVGSVNGLFKGVLPLYAVAQDLRQVDRHLGVATAPPPAPAPLTAKAAEIVLERVSFRYSESSPWVLRDFSLSIAPGELYRLSAASGAGKTTILRLVAGLLEPTEGRVLVGGREATRARDAVAYLPQEALLFEGSLLDNLRVLSGAPLAAILDAARATGLDAWLATLPMGIETVVPPGGGNISGGQRQLVLLTAAVASRKPVLLLDEALAHIDPLTRAGLRERSLFSGRTVIEVLHER